MGEYFLNKDGLYIHFRRWIPQGNIHPLPPKGIVVLVHGLGEHCARYDHVARALNALGFVVYGLDHQGHGRSEGDRLHLNTFQDYVDDVMGLVSIAKSENPLIAKKTYILGHSMGGKL
jgi:alpha-beta hydrolase superfamily lysophospholipase